MNPLGPSGFWRKVPHQPESCYGVSFIEAAVMVLDILGRTREIRNGARWKDDRLMNGRYFEIDNESTENGDE